MAKKQAPNKLTKEQEQLVRKIQQYILSNNSSIINIRGVKNAIADEDDGFFFKNNDAANKEATRLINEMARKIDGLLLTGIEKAWKIGNDDLENNIKSGLTSSQRDKKLLDEISKQATQSARGKTAENYYKQKVDGLNISDRVWNLAGNAKKEIEIIVQNGIKEGKGADEIQKSIRGYLNEPDKLFRRVLNKKTGEYELSKAAKKYHPGQGVYRSAYKNAMRLARTELKAASCEAAWLSAQNNPLIVGWKIVLSNNHTMLVKGVPVKFKDICDELQGTYPKSFKFKGWHPQCRCEMLPVLISKNERVDLYKSIFDKKREGFNPKVITDVPDNFNKWVDENKKRQTASSATPYFVRDNFKGGILAGGLMMPSILKPEVSAMMPVEIASKSVYLRGEDYVFDRKFFDLLDKNKSVKVEIAKKGGSYFSPPGKIHIENGQRAEKSNWERKAVIYHEYGHAIDWQRGLRYDRTLSDLRKKQISWLRKKDIETIWVRQFNYSKGVYENVKITTSMSKVAYIDHKLKGLYQKVMRMSTEVFTRRGISKWDVLEQIRSTQDTIKSLVVSYGEGHSTSYFRRVGAKEAEYLAHAFENAFLGNRVFQKYMPEIYEEMIAYIKTLK